MGIRHYTKMRDFMTHNKRKNRWDREEDKAEDTTNEDFDLNKMLSGDEEESDESVD